MTEGREGLTNTRILEYIHKLPEARDGLQGSGNTMSTAVASTPEGRPEDPDAQATVNDYLDYTEYLPSDLNRALTLIGKLDENYLTRANNVHELTKQYGALSSPSSAGVDPGSLRRDIAHNLDLALKAREAAYGEAERLNEMVNRHYNRLMGIKTKLLALPKPPSRDPTPVARSPPTTRKTPSRITLRLDNARPAASTGRLGEKEKRKARRSRRVTIPGEVLPPPNADSPHEYTESDWESIPPSPLPMPTSRVGGSRSRSHKSSRNRPPKTPKSKTPRPPRIPGKGTNVHSQVAGISTSNALSMLPKPPPDAERGSEHAPWMRLTEYEMALLRKKMKKNAIWTPSETMIRRELAGAGRGPENYRTRKTECEEQGEEFLDVDDIASSSPSKPLAPGEIRAGSLGAVSENLSNRGMKLNEAKKQKREAMLLASLHETQQATKRLQSLGSNFKELFKKPMSSSLESPLTPSGFATNNRISGESSAKLKKKKSDASKKSADDQLSKMPKQGAASKPESVQIMAKPATPTAAVSLHKETSKKRKPETPAATEQSTRIRGPLAPEASNNSAEQETPRKRSKSAELTNASASSRRSKRPLPDTETSKPAASVVRTRHVPLTLRGPASPPKTVTKPRGPLRDEPRDYSTGPLSAPLTRSNTRRQSATPATPATPMTPAPVMTAASLRSRRPAPSTNQKDVEGGPIDATERPTKPSRNGKGSSKKNTLQGKENELVGNDEAGDEMDLDDKPYCFCNQVSEGPMVSCDDPSVRAPSHGVWLLSLTSMLTVQT